MPLALFFLNIALPIRDLLWLKPPESSLTLMSGPWLEDWRTRAAARNTCLQPLHVAWASAQHGSLCAADLAPQTIKCPFCHILLVTSKSQAQRDSREGIRLYLLIGEWKDLEEQMEWEITVLATFGKSNLPNSFLKLFFSLYGIFDER